MNLKHFYDNGKFSDIDIISSDGIKKSLHKLVLTKYSNLLGLIINDIDKKELMLNVKWIYLEPILNYMYTSNFNYNYSNLSDDNINITIKEFENILHCGVHLQLSSFIIEDIIEHFDYMKRLNKCTMRDLCNLLYSLKRVTECKYIGKNLDIIIHLCNKIVLQNLLKCDSYLDVYGDDFGNFLTNEIYNNIKCVWRLDSILSITITEFINYNLNKLKEYVIDYDNLYLIANNSNINDSHNDKCICNDEQEEFNDSEYITNLNNIILECISTLVLDNPSHIYNDIYMMLCNNKNIHKKIIDKILHLSNNINKKNLVINELNKKLTCSICMNSELDCVLKTCGHIFCRSCLDEMILQHRSGSSNYLQCPVCKKEFSKYDLINIFL